MSVQLTLTNAIASVIQRSAATSRPVQNVRLSVLAPSNENVSPMKAAM
jgi:hypothetical protein